MISQNRHFRTANEAYLASLMPRRRAHAVAFLLVLIFFGELVVSVHRQSLSWDEGDHIYAGDESWAAGEFGINPGHPPLLKEIATVPLLTMHLSAPPRKSPRFSKTEAYFNGRSLIDDNGRYAALAACLRPRPRRSWRSSEKVAAEAGLMLCTTPSHSTPG